MAKRILPENLVKFCVEVFVKAGLRTDYACTVADVLVMAVRYDRKNQRRLYLSNRIQMAADVLDRPSLPFAESVTRDLICK